MLYLRALLRGLAALPQADPLLRSQLDARAAKHGWPALHAELPAWTRKRRRASRRLTANGSSARSKFVT